MCRELTVLSVFGCVLFYCVSLVTPLSSLEITRSDIVEMELSLGSSIIFIK